MYGIAFPLFSVFPFLSFQHPLPIPFLIEVTLFFWAFRGCKRFPQLPRLSLSLCVHLFHLPWPYFRLYVLVTSPRLPSSAPFSSTPCHAFRWLMATVLVAAAATFLSSVFLALFIHLSTLNPWPPLNKGFSLRSSAYPSRSIALVFFGSSCAFFSPPSWLVRYAQKACLCASCGCT